jgi:hypothetical protein
VKPKTKGRNKERIEKVQRLEREGVRRLQIRAEMRKEGRKAKKNKNKNISQRSCSLNAHGFGVWGLVSQLRP